MLLREDLERLAPCPADKARAAVWDGYVDALTSAEGGAALAEIAHIANNLELVHALATFAGETGGFTVLWENMSYRAERIMEVFGVGRHSAGITAAEAKGLAGNAYALAERVYGLGNPKKAAELGNLEPGDGYKYRGLGIGQTTGRDAHERYAKAIGCPVDELSQPINTLKASCLEWGEGGCNERAGADDVVGVRRIWNGGLNGIEHVRAHLAKAKKIWPAGASEPKEMVDLGDEGDHVKQIQRHLADKGFSAGKVDGKFGSLTQRQVAAFQVAHGLLGTGKVDRRTWELISEPTAPVEAVPGRETIDAKELAARGSKTVQAGVSVSFIGRVLTWLGIGGTVDAVAGIGAAEAIVGQAEKLAAVAARGHSLLGTVLSVRFLVIAGAVILGSLLVNTGARIVAARVRDAQKGNTTR